MLLPHVQVARCWQPRTALGNSSSYLLLSQLLLSNLILLLCYTARPAWSYSTGHIEPLLFSVVGMATKLWSRFTRLARRCCCRNHWGSGQSVNRCRRSCGDIAGDMLHSGRELADND